MRIQLLWIKVYENLSLITIKYILLILGISYFQMMSALEVD